MGARRKKRGEGDAPPPEPGPFGTPSFFAEAASDEEELDRLVKSVEAAARRSMELRDYIKFLRDEVHMDRCHFLRGLSTAEVEIEVHHHPLTLYDVCEAVVRAHMCGERGETSSLLMAQEAVRLHYERMVGLVPLSKTMHELAHSGKLHVPATAVWGDVAGFVGRYRHHLGTRVLQKLEDLCSADEAEWSARNAEVLAVRPVFNPRALLTESGPTPELPEPAKKENKQ